MDRHALALREPWVPAFFGNGNQLLWADLPIGSSGWTAMLQPWFALIEAGLADRGVILPALALDGSSTWYACATSRQDSAALAEQIASFLGPASVDFDRTSHLVPSTQPERVLAERFGGGVQRFTTRAGEDATKVANALSLLAGLLQRRPPRVRIAVRPFGTVRAEFEQALLTGAEAQARRCIEELRTSGRLSAANERFMQVRLLVALGREATLVSDGSTMSLLADADLPVRVLREVIEAIYTVHLAPLAPAAPASDWVSAFRERVSRHERLLRSRRGLRAPAALRVFLLREVAKPPAEFRTAEAEVIHGILATLPEHRAWADALLDWARRQQPTAIPLGTLSQTATVSTAPNAPDELQLRQLALQPPSAPALAALLRCALDVGTLEAAATALNAVRAYPKELLSAMSPLQRAVRDTLEKLVPDPIASVAVPTDWTEWARWWIHASPGEELRAQAIADQGTEEWDLAPWLSDHAKIAEFTNLMLSHPARFRTFLPEVHKSLQGVVGAAPMQVSVYATMLTVVSLDSPSPLDLPLLADWLAALVELGAGRSTCDEVAGALHAAWSEVRSPRTLDWACDVVELLASAPRSPGGDLETLFSDILGFAGQQQHRLSATQRQILALLARDFGLDFTFAEATTAGQEPATPTRTFAGTSIGIYTLQESIVPHLRQALQVALPGATIEFNHDHVATSALEHMARNCSVMVFAWLCSKHQAFYCVQKYRPANRPLLQPQGRGSASIVRMLTDYFSNVAC